MPHRQAFETFRRRYETTMADQLRGNSEPFLELWSRRPDIMIFGGLGGYERGWPEVASRLRWAATLVEARLVRIESLQATISGEMALTADLEHMLRQVDGAGIERALRVTHGLRIEDGEWRIFYRHADEYRPSGR